MSELTKSQIEELKNNPQIQATIKRNKSEAGREREAKLMLLGYNQALLDTNQIPSGMTRQYLEAIVTEMKEKLLPL